MTTDRHDLLEALAAYAHEAWSRWMLYLFRREPPCIPDGCTWGPPRYLIRRGGCFTPYAVIGFRVRCKNCGKVVKDIFLYGYDKIGKEGTDEDFYKEGYYVEADDNRLEEIRRVGPSREECTK